MFKSKFYLQAEDPQLKAFFANASDALIFLAGIALGHEEVVDKFFDALKNIEDKRKQFEKTATDQES